MVKWRPWLVKWHRDIGYLFAGLTLIYAFSGLAVNHRRHWDYDHARSATQITLGTPGVAHEHVRKRRFMYYLNRIHLNDHNAIWIWFAEAYALGLIFLAVSGAFMLEGKSGVRGRGWWLVLAGLILPIVVLALA